MKGLWDQTDVDYIDEGTFTVLPRSIPAKWKYLALYFQLILQPISTFLVQKPNRETIQQ